VISEKPEQMPDNATDRPLVTFALFSYKQEHYIREAIEAAFAQAYQPLEIILSDN
jgi:glycosyltransferase involved in cell wall biosynthesis